LQQSLLGWYVAPDSSLTQLTGCSTDQYPLVVRLPCHKSHIFDLECIEPWLRLHPTCPLDRKDLIKKKEPPPPPPEDDEEEYDDMYA